MLLFLLFALAAAVLCHAALITVSSDQDSGFGTLRNAIDISNSNPDHDTVWLSVTTYNRH